MAAEGTGFRGYNPKFSWHSALGYTAEAKQQSLPRVKTLKPSPAAQLGLSTLAGLGFRVDLGGKGDTPCPPVLGLIVCL